MTSLTSYSPFETLLFFQNVVRYGADTPAFQEISAALSQNQLLRKEGKADDERLSAGALQKLYNELINAERNVAVVETNGDSESGVSNPRKRKLSASPPPNDNQLDDKQELIQWLVDKLYAKYKERVIREIKQEEQAYVKLQAEIRELEGKVEADAHAATNGKQPSDAHTTGNIPEVSAHTVVEDEKPIAAVPHQTLAQTIIHQPSNSTLSQTQPQQVPTPGTIQAKSVTPSIDNEQQPVISTTVESPKPRSVSGTPHARQSQPPQLPSQPQQHQSPVNFQRPLPPPSPQRPAYGPAPAQQTFPSGSRPQISPRINSPVPGTQPMQPPVDYSASKKGPPQGRGSPMPLTGQVSYPQYSQYPPQQWHSPIPQQYQSQLPYGPQYYPQPAPGRHTPLQTPQQGPHLNYPHTAPIPYPGPQWAGPFPHQPFYSYPASANTTPIPRPGNRTSLIRSTNSTPWKRRSTNVGPRLSSPPLVNREVSPLSDRGSPEPEVPLKRSNREALSTHPKREKESSASRRKADRTGSATPSAHTLSRSHSPHSHISEASNERTKNGKRQQKTKAELQNTPIPGVSDSDQPQKSSGRRGRPRKDEKTVKVEGGKTIVTGKRKRSSIASVSPSPTSRQSGLATSRPVIARYDPSLVVVSTNFARTSQLLLNEITSHKLAGIFAKPLSERDAPGYKNLVLQSQDLKSIKAAVSKGSRAAIAIIEALEADEKGDSDLTPTKSVEASGRNGEGSLGNGFFLVRKTEDLLPPKGIVNSSQLEMELVRMFANAVMFNPLPSSERGFGRSLRLRRKGGDIPVNPDESVSSSDEGTPLDEGGIIFDAREMFDDVVTIIGRWRSLEEERKAGNGGSTSSFITATEHQSGSGRQMSISTSSVLGHDEDEDVEATPSVSVVGVGRKRRRIGEP